MRRSLHAGVSALMTLIVPLSPSFVHRQVRREIGSMGCCKWIKDGGRRMEAGRRGRGRAVNRQGQVIEFGDVNRVRYRRSLRHASERVCCDAEQERVVGKSDAGVGMYVYNCCGKRRVVGWMGWLYGRRGIKVVES